MTELDLDAVEREFRTFPNVLAVIELCREQRKVIEAQKRTVKFAKRPEVEFSGSAIPDIESFYRGYASALRDVKSHGLPIEIVDTDSPQES